MTTTPDVTPTSVPEPDISALIHAAQNLRAVLDGIDVLARAVQMWRARAEEAEVRATNLQTALDTSPMAVYDVVFDGPPDHEGGRFVEVEDGAGKSISAGRWLSPSESGTDFWILRLPRLVGDLQPLVDEQTTLIGQLVDQRDAALAEARRAHEIKLDRAGIEKAIAGTAEIASLMEENELLKRRNAKMANDLVEARSQTELARQDREQAEEDADSMSGVVSRVERVRTDLAREIAAHLETKDALKRESQLLASARAVAEERRLELERLREPGSVDGKAVRRAVRAELARARVWNGANPEFASDEVNSFASDEDLR